MKTNSLAFLGQMQTNNISLSAICICLSCLEWNSKWCLEAKEFFKLDSSCTLKLICNLERCSQASPNTVSTHMHWCKMEQKVHVYLSEPAWYPNQSMWFVKALNWNAWDRPANHLFATSAPYDCCILVSQLQSQRDFSNVLDVKWVDECHHASMLKFEIIFVVAQSNFFGSWCCQCNFTLWVCFTSNFQIFCCWCTPHQLHNIDALPARHIACCYKNHFFMVIQCKTNQWPCHSTCDSKVKAWRVHTSNQKCVIPMHSCVDTVIATIIGKAKQMIVGHLRIKKERKHSENALLSFLSVREDSFARLSWSKLSTSCPVDSDNDQCGAVLTSLIGHCCSWFPIIMEQSNIFFNDRGSRFREKDFTDQQLTLLR